MKNKILSLFLVSLMIIPVFTPVFAISYEDYKTRLNGIKADILSMKNEYQSVLDDYSYVIDSLSEENRQNALTLADNLMGDDIKAKRDAIKSELNLSTVLGASEVLDAIDILEDEAKAIINDNEDIVDNIKSGYMELTIDEVKEIIDEVNEITDSLGYTVDTTDTYNDLVKIIDDAHLIGQDINDKINDLLDESINDVNEIVSLDFLKELFNGVKNKNKEAVIETLKNAFKGTSNEDNIKSILDDIKQDIKSLKNKLLEANDLDEEVLIKFEDDKKDAISSKVVAIEQDYIDFAKAIIDSFAEDYIHEISTSLYDEKVDDMIKYANDVLDFISEYKDTIKNLYNNPLEKIKNHNFSYEIEDAIKKAGILVAIGFADTSTLNFEYIYNKFKPEIKSIADFVSDEFLDYIDHIDVVLKKEITDEISDNTATVAQTNIRDINAKRFKTLEDIKALKNRVENEVIAEFSKFDDLDKIIKKVAPLVYKMYYANMLDGVEKIMLLENEKDDKKFEFNEARGYILADSFMSIDCLEEIIGIPDEYKNILTYDKLNELKIMTTSTIEIKFSEEVFGNYTIAVLGDVYADGRINSQDYMAIKNEIMETKALASINKIAANTYRDNKIDSRDYMKIKNYIMNGSKIRL